MKPIYLVERSMGVDIQIEQEELSKVVEGIKTGKMIVVNQGIINPKYISGIVKDYKDMKIYTGGIELEDIFKETKIKLLTNPKNKLL